MQKAATDPPFFPKGGLSTLSRARKEPTSFSSAHRDCLSKVVDASALDALQKKKKKKKTPHQTGDPEDPDEESNVVSMSSDGRTPAVSDSARRSETTPSIAENT